MRTSRWPQYVREHDRIRTLSYLEPVRDSVGNIVAYLLYIREHDDSPLVIVEHDDLTQAMVRYNLDVYIYDIHRDYIWLMQDIQAGVKAFIPESSGTLNILTFKFGRSEYKLVSSQVWGHGQTCDAYFLEHLANVQKLYGYGVHPHQLA